MPNTQLPARIGKITQKKTGTEFHVLRTGRDAAVSDSWDSMADASATAFDLFEHDLAGYVLVVWDFERRHSAFIRTTRGGPLMSYELPQAVAEMVRRECSDCDVREMLFAPPQKEDR